MVLEEKEAAEVGGKGVVEEEKEEEEGNKSVKYEEKKTINMRNNQKAD